MLLYALLVNVMFSSVLLCHVMLYYVASRYITLSCVVLWYVALCGVMLSYFISCYVLHTYVPFGQGNVLVRSFECFFDVCSRKLAVASGVTLASARGRAGLSPTQ